MNYILLLCAIYLILFPLLSRYWVSTMLFFLCYLAFEGLLRRAAGSYHQYIFLAKDFLLLPVYSGAFVFLVKKKKAFKLYFPKKTIWLFLLIVSICFVNFINALYNNLFPAIISLKLFLFYLPLLFVGFALSLKHDDVMDMISKKIAWIIIPISIMTIFQWITGWGTAITAYGSIVDTGGTIERQNYISGTIITISSTFFGGRLGSFSGAWTIILFALANYTTGTRLKWYLTALTILSFVNLIFGTNNTAFFTTISLICISFLYYSYLNRFHSLRIIFIMVIIGFTAILSIYQFFSASPSYVFQKRKSNFNFEALSNFYKAPTQKKNLYVVTNNLWNGLAIAYSQVGFWGKGLGQFTSGMAYIAQESKGGVVFNKIRGVESFVLKIIVEIGLPGLLAFAFFYSSIILFFLSKLFTPVKNNKNRRIIMGVGLSLFLYYLMLSYKHHGFAGDPTLLTYVFTFVGISIKYASHDKNKLNINSGIDIGAL